MPSLDALFVHVPRWSAGRREVMVLPLGVPALANLLADEGRTVDIVHQGIERELDAGFSLRALLEETRPRLVLLSLHWHLQTRPVLDAAARVRAWAPGARVVVGGLTASAFAAEVAALPFVDAVVRGDGEEPLRRLAAVILDGRGTLADVPNLLWRDGDRVRENAAAWVLDEATAARLRHGSLARLRHREAYLDRALYADFSEGAAGAAGYRRAVYLNSGRGCPAPCLLCGGGAEGQRATSRREGVLNYPLAKLMADLREAAAEGAEVLRSSFDPPASRPHQRAWFARIAAEGPPLAAIADLFGLPARPYLADFARAFRRPSTVVLSPECGSEAVRARVRGARYSNERLLDAIRAAADLGLGVHVFFSAGLPTETPADVDATARLIERIRRETPAAVSVCPMTLDPASPVHLAPQRHGVRLVRRTLRDFYDGRGLEGGPGYVSEHFDERAARDACARLIRAAGLPPAPWEDA